MEFLLPVILFLLAAAAALGWKVHLLRRAVREIGSAFRQRLTEDTNTLIDVPCRDPAVRSLASDINAQLRLLRAQRRRYQQGDRQLKEAVTDLSHDLRTPLTALCGYLELLKQQELPPQAGRYLAQIEDRAQAMKALTAELFAYSLAVSGQPLSRSRWTCGGRWKIRCLPFTGRSAKREWSRRWSWISRTASFCWTKARWAGFWATSWPTP